MTTTTIFDAFRIDLDSHNDRRERLIKASRDITNISKKTIFLLHRIVLETPRDEDTEPSAIRAAKRGRENLRQVHLIYANMKDEFVGDRFWRYERQVSPGLQEYIEALSFAHFLEHGTLITLPQVQQTLCDSDGVPLFPLTTSDYLLGISDLTGELMRYAISGLSKRGGRSQAMETLAFVRNCKADFDLFTPSVPYLSKKQSVTAQSMKKIEEAAYAIVVRTSEYDLSPAMLDDLVAQTMAGNERKRKERASDDDFD
ncbi:Translin [Hymenopellis radicata]|nr:Translin [Hymenopellis radicata]